MISSGREYISFSSIIYKMYINMGHKIEIKAVELYLVIVTYYHMENKT